MNGYNLSRRWFDFTFENHEAKVQHTAIYLWCVELNNRLGWKENFQLPTSSTMEGLSIGNKNTFLSALKDLEKWGFLKIILEPKNQNQARIISLCRSESEPADGTALDTALIQQSDSTGNGTGVGTVPIDKQINQETNTEEKLDKKNEEIVEPNPEPKPKPKTTRNKKEFVPPTVEEMIAYFVENNKDPQKAKEAFNYYNNFGWKDKNGSKVENWKQKMHGTWFRNSDISEFNRSIKMPKDQGDAQMNRLLQKGLDVVSGEELEWIYDWQHRTNYTYLEYPDDIRVVGKTTRKTKAQCREENRSAGYGNY